MTGALPRKPSSTFGKWVHDRLASEVQVNSVPNARVSRTTRGVSIETDAKKGSGGKVRKYVLKDASQPDYFICRSISGTGSLGTADVNIGKPLHLRRSTFDGKLHETECETYEEEVLATETRTYGYEYKSATLRVKSDLTDFVDVADLDTMADLGEYEPEELTAIVEEVQIVVPRFVPATITDTVELNEEGDPITTTEMTGEAPTMLYAISCPSFTATPNVTEEVPDPEAISINKVALNDSWAWASI